MLRPGRNDSEPLAYYTKEMTVARLGHKRRGKSMHLYTYVYTYAIRRIIIILHVIVQTLHRIRLYTGVRFIRRHGSKV